MYLSKKYKSIASYVKQILCFQLNFIYSIAMLIDTYSWNLPFFYS